MQPNFLFDICGISNAFIEKQVDLRREELPSKVEYLFGCENCSFSEVGCKFCDETAFASRPAARAKPKEGRPQHALPPAPTFRPTAAEWQDPFAYLSSIAPVATKAGIALIIPPPGWEPPIQMLDQQTGQLRTDMEVPVRIQPTHLLCRRWPTPAGAPPESQRRSSEDGSSSDSDEDLLLQDGAGGPAAGAAAAARGGSVERRSRSPQASGRGQQQQQQAAAKKSNAVTGRCSKAGVAQQHSAVAAAAAAAAGSEEGSEGGSDDTTVDAVAAAAAAASDGQFGYEHLEEPLNLFEFHRYADWAKRRHFNGPLLASLDKEQAAAAGSGSNQQQQQPPIVAASNAWRTCPLTPAVRAARSVAGSWVPGSDAAGANGSAPDAWREPSVEEVEAEFWRIVEVANEQVEALYGQDIDTANYCSAFPTIKELAARQAARLLQPPAAALTSATTHGDVQQLAAAIGAAGSDDPCHSVTVCDCGKCDLCVLRVYAAHPWNINNLPQGKGSVLRFVREDVGGKPITGLMVPWVYVGSCFSAFCWHIEDHGLYSINYNHMGAPKVWYGVPAAAAAALDAAMRDALPHLFDNDRLLLHKLITMLSPAQLAARGVPVCRAVQVPGSFVVTFPDAYHAGFNSGFNVAEAVNFAAPNWLPFGSSSVVRYRNEARYMTFSHDAMLINVVREAVDAAAGRTPALLLGPAAAAAAPVEAAAAGAAAGGRASSSSSSRHGLKAQFAATLDATAAQCDAAEAAAAERAWAQRRRNVAPADAGATDGSSGEEAAAVQLVAPPLPASAGSGGRSTPAVSFASGPLDTDFWWKWHPDQSWADAAAVADEAAAHALRRQQPEQQQPEQRQSEQRQLEQRQLEQQQQEHQPEQQQAPACAAPNHQGGRERGGLMMRGAAGAPAPLLLQGDEGEEEAALPEIVPGMPVAGAAAAAAAAGPPPAVVAAAARGLAVAAFSPTLPAKQPAGGSKAPKQPGSAEAVAAAEAAVAAAEAAVAAAALEAAAGARAEVAVSALTTYIRCLAEARRQRLLVHPPSPELAAAALGELALRVELEQQRSAALLLQAGITASALMAGSSAALHRVTGVHTNTQGVECAVCGNDLSLASVVSSEDPGRAVCVAHAGDLDGPRSAARLLLRYPPGHLDRLVAQGMAVVPGAAAAVAAARRRQGWVAAGRFFGGLVVRKPAAAAAAPGGADAPGIGDGHATPSSVPAEAAAEPELQQQPAAAAGAAAQREPQPVVEVTLLGRLYDPRKLSSKLFEELDEEEDSDADESGSDSELWAQEQQQAGPPLQAQHVLAPSAPAAAAQLVASAAAKLQQPAGAQLGAAPGGDSGGDASSGSVFEEEEEAQQRQHEAGSSKPAAAANNSNSTQTVVPAATAGSPLDFLPLGATVPRRKRSRVSSSDGGGGSKRRVLAVSSLPFAAAPAGDEAA